MVALELRTGIVLLLFQMLHTASVDRNVAVRKNAYQTDTLGFAASLAVDGNTAGNFGYGSCTHTKTSNVTWEVDLGAFHNISSVKVYNRVDCCSERLLNVQLYIGMSRDDYVVYGYHSGIVNVSCSFTFGGYVIGRWVKIGRVNVTYALTLCEVQVFGHPYTQVMCSTDAHQQIATGSLLSTMQVRTELQCAHACLTSGACLAAMYSSTLNVCSLYETVSSYTVANDSGILILPHYDEE